MAHPLDGIPLPHRLRRTELKQSPQGDWYVNLLEGETIVGMDFNPIQYYGHTSGGGGGGGTPVPRKPVVWILTDEIVTEVMGIEST